MGPFTELKRHGEVKERILYLYYTWVRGPSLLIHSIT